MAWFRSAKERNSAERGASASAGSCMMIVGGPKHLHLLNVNGRPVLLLGETHHTRERSITVVDMVSHLMQCAPDAQLFVEAARIHATRKATDKATNQLVRVAHTYSGRSWAVDVRRLSAEARELNKVVFEAAERMHDRPVISTRAMQRFRKDLWRVLMYVFSLPLPVFVEF